MAHGLLVLHFGAQCPWQPWVVEQARQAARRLGGTVRIVDVARQPKLAERHRLFFPFMTVVDESIRLPSPTQASELVSIAKEGLAVPTAVTTTESPAAQAEVVLPLTAANIRCTCALCSAPSPQRGCQAKAAWAARLARQMPSGVLGFVAYHSRHLVGAVEFLAAPLIPYPLPRKPTSAAFITCLYSAEDGLDYRADLLSRLEHHLAQAGYHELQVVAGQCSAYPNGPAALFQDRGFQRVGVVDRVTLREGTDTLVLLRRELRSRFTLSAGRRAADRTQQPQSP